MTFEQEFTDQLIRLAECRIDSAAWQSWWALHSEEVKKMGWQRGIPVFRLPYRHLWTRYLYRNGNMPKRSRTIFDKERDSISACYAL